MHTASTWLLSKTEESNTSQFVRVFLCRIHHRLRKSYLCRVLFALHLPNPERVRADYAVLAELSKGLSGGDIINICLNAIYAGSTDLNPERWLVTQTMIEAEIAKARKAKVEHSGEKAWPRRRIGFCER